MTYTSTVNTQNVLIYKVCGKIAQWTQFQSIGVSLFCRLKTYFDQVCVLEEYAFGEKIQFSTWKKTELKRSHLAIECSSNKSVCDLGNAGVEQLNKDKAISIVFNIKRWNHTKAVNG